ncbi:MAG: phenylalanine--tRNA ligase subunit alpha [Malacoplasma sp.]
MLKKEINIFIESISNIDNEKKVIEVKNKFFKDHFVNLYDVLRKSTPEEKKTLGSVINELKQEIEEIVLKRIEEINISISKNYLPDFDVSLPSDNIKSGYSNPIDIIIEKLNDFFLALSFQIVNGNEIVTTEYNFAKLNIKDGHPAMDMHDSFFISKDVLLRTHCTAVTSKVIHNCKSQEMKVVSFGNVYRKDEDDATHSHQFNQLDLVWIKEDLSISNLKWLVDKLLKYLFDDSIKTRYRLSYFPFTEPSFEVDISCFKCKSLGCNICKKTGWIEILGAGILHPNVIRDANIDKKFVGIAAGIGIDRLAMLKYGISDIRDIYNNNFRLLEQFRGAK